MWLNKVLRYHPKLCTPRPIHDTNTLSLTCVDLTARATAGNTADDWIEGEVGSYNTATQVVGHVDYSAWSRSPIEGWQMAAIQAYSG